MTMSRTVVRGTPYSSVKAGNTEGQAPGKPSGYTGTVGGLYGDDSIPTGPSKGTPYQSRAGNGPSTKRVVSADTYGKVMSNQQGNANDPMNTGPGVLLAGMGEAHSPPPAGALDSPVPGSAPHFNPADMIAENRSHLGSGNEGGLRDLVNSTGVMGRGMAQKSTPGGSEFELTDDDTLPGTAPA